MNKLLVFFAYAVSLVWLALFASNIITYKGNTPDIYWAIEGGTSYLVIPLLVEFIFLIAMIFLIIKFKAFSYMLISLLVSSLVLMIMFIFSGQVFITFGSNLLTLYLVFTLIGFVIHSITLIWWTNKKAII